MATFSIEKLWHFQCDPCKKWWTVGDYEDMCSVYVACPWCHEVQGYRPAEPDELMGK